MAITYYPSLDDAVRGTFEERIELLLDAAESYKAVVLETISHATAASNQSETDTKSIAPKDLHHAYNWEEMAIILREVRELPEGTSKDRIRKANLLTMLAEVYEVLRAARMSKLEAVRLALISEVNQLRGGSTASVQAAS